MSDWFCTRGYAYLKPKRRDVQTPTQGDLRQAMVVAQKCASVCGTIAPGAQLFALAATLFGLGIIVV